MKSICMLDQTHYEFDTRVKRKAEALVAAGYSVDVLSLRCPGAKKTFIQNGVTVHTFPLSKKHASLLRHAFEYAAFFLWAFVKVPLLMRHRKYSIIEANTLPDFLIFAPVLARWMGAKLVLDMHELMPEFYFSKYGIAPGSWQVRLLKYLERICMRFADHVMTVNEPIQDLLVGRGLDRAKSTVVMNAADETIFQPEPVAATSSVAADSSNFAVMYHGTLAPRYGLDIAIEAFNIAHHEMPRAELWILGFGPDEERLKKLVDDRGLTSKVRMLGAMPPTEVAWWLRRCDMGIVPLRRDAYYEFAFPNKLPEYIIMGKVVVSSRLKTIEHYFSDEALIYAEPNDAADLAKQLVRVYRDRGSHARRVARALEEYAPLRWDVMKQRYLRVIGELSGPLKHTAQPSPAVEPA
jgi:glycosyltransferase involved in cell wall biosynthesis